jgi:hypothetical protein
MAHMDPGVLDFGHQVTVVALAADVALVEDAVLVGVSAEVWAGLEAMAEASDGEDSILLGEDGETAGHPYPEETKEIYFGKEVLLCQDLTEQAPGAKAR